MKRKTFKIKGNLINLDISNSNDRVYSKDVISNYIKNCSDNSEFAMIPITEINSYDNYCAGPIIGYCKIFIENSKLKFDGEAHFDPDDNNYKFLNIKCMGEAESRNRDGKLTDYITAIEDYSMSAYFYSDSSFYTESNIEIYDSMEP